MLHCRYAIFNLLYRTDKEGELTVALESYINFPGVFSLEKESEKQTTNKVRRQPPPVSVKMFRLLWKSHLQVRKSIFLVMPSSSKYYDALQIFMVTFPNTAKLWVNHLIYYYAFIFPVMKNHIIFKAKKIIKIDLNLYKTKLVFICMALRERNW